MLLKTFHLYFLIFVYSLVLFSLTTKRINAQEKTISGKVYAFKNLELSNIKLSTKKSGNIAYTDSNGTFSINCNSNDKLVICGQGFQKTTIKTVNKESFQIKIIFKGNDLNKKKAINANHTKKVLLEHAIANYSDYNRSPEEYPAKNTVSYKKHIKRERDQLSDFDKNNSILSKYYSNRPQSYYINPNIK